LGGDDQNRAGRLVFEPDLAGLLDEDFALDHAAIRTELDEAGLEALDAIEIGADLVEIGFLLIAVSLVQALGYGLAGAAQKGDRDKGGKAERKSAHQQKSHGKMEKIGPICGRMWSKIDSAHE